jgi:hypothetical protein
MNPWYLPLGVLVLGFFVVHSLLIVAAIGVDLGPLRALQRAFARRAPLRARVVGGDGPSGRLASRVVEQVGRSNGDAWIHFHDRRASSEIDGGEIEVLDPGGAGRLGVQPGQRLRLAPGTTAQVWIDEARVKAAAACPDGAAFEVAHAAAVKARGYVREVVLGVHEGDEIWIDGDVLGDEVRAPDVAGATLLVADAPPARWLAARVARARLIQVAILLIAAAIVVACVWPPLFGLVGKLGAAAGLVFINLFMLWGKVVRDGVRLPEQAFVRGEWKRDGTR